MNFTSGEKEGKTYNKDLSRSASDVVQQARGTGIADISS